MVSAGGERGRVGQEENPLRLLGFLMAYKRAAYVLVVIVLVHLSNQYDRYLFSVSKVPFVDYDSLDFALIAGPFFTAFNSLAGVMLSFVGDARPVRLLSTACLIWSASTGAVAFTQTFWQVALARVGQGIGDAACSPFAVTILRDHFGPEYIGSAIGVYFVGLYAGYSLALGAGTLLDDAVGWKWAYLLAALAGVVVAAVTFLTVPEPPPLGPLMPRRRDSATPTTPEGSSLVCMTSRSSSSGPLLSPPYSQQQVSREEENGSPAEARPAARQYGSSRQAADGGGGGSNEKGEDAAGGTALVAEALNASSLGSASSPVAMVAPSRAAVDSRLSARNGTQHRPLLLPAGAAEEGLGPRDPSSGSSYVLSRQHLHRHSTSSGSSRFRGNLSELLAVWLGSPSLLLVCVAAGVRDAGGFVFGYYLAAYFSPLLEGNLALTQHGNEPCLFSFDAGFSGSQICDAAFPWCVDGSCSRLTGSPWHDVGMSASKLEMFVSWVPLVGGSLGAMTGGFLSDRVAQRLGTAGRLWVVVIGNALASPFAAGVLLAPYPWCFVCLLFVEILGEMWIGVALAVVMALVPRHVRVTSVALYNFIITNVSGLSTTLVPLLRERYDSPHTFRFFAEPLAGAAAVATAAAAASTSSWSGRSGDSVGNFGSSLVYFPPRSGLLEEAAVGGMSGEDGVWGGDGQVEYSVSERGSHGLQAAMLLLYPGLYLASSFFCLAAILALSRDQKAEAAAAVSAAAAAAVAERAAAAAEELEPGRYARLSHATKGLEVFESARLRRVRGNSVGGVEEGGSGGDCGRSVAMEGGGDAGAEAVVMPLLRGEGEAAGAGKLPASEDC